MNLWGSERKVEVLELGSGGFSPYLEKKNSEGYSAYGVDQDPRGSFDHLKNQYQEYCYKNQVIMNQFFPYGFPEYTENYNIIEDDILNFIQDIENKISEVFASFVFNNLDTDYNEKTIIELSEKTEENAIITITQYYGPKLLELFKILKSNNFTKIETINQDFISLEDSLCYPLKVAMNKIDNGDRNRKMQRLIYQKNESTTLFFI